MNSHSQFCALVVDDEEIVREVTAMIFEENGARTLSASGGDEALAIFKEHRDKIDLVFLDFSMPGKNGYQIFLEMQALDSTIGYVMGSGLSISNDVAACQLRGEIEFVSKPYNELELMGAAKKVLKKRGIIL